MEELDFELVAVEGEDGGGVGDAVEEVGGECGPDEGLDDVEGPVGGGGAVEEGLEEGFGGAGAVCLLGHVRERLPGSEWEGFALAAVVALKGRGEDRVLRFSGWFLISGHIAAVWRVKLPYFWISCCCRLGRCLAAVQWMH